MADSERIPMEELEPRRLYRIRSRNLIVGVWNGHNGFVGVREKLGSEYLFTELHYDADPRFGTVTHMEATDEILPEGIELVEGHSLCQVCKEPDEWVQTEGERTGVWHHVVRTIDTDHDAKSAYFTNEPFFAWLKERGGGP